MKTFKEFKEYCHFYDYNKHLRYGQFVYSELYLINKELADEIDDKFKLFSLTQISQDIWNYIENNWNEGNSEQTSKELISIENEIVNSNLISPKQNINNRVNDLIEFYNWMQQYQDLSSAIRINECENEIELIKIYDKIKKEN
jgi:uncharacterized protein YfkK (UPF0435 family)